jgi:hypothetical protein
VSVGSLIGLAIYIYAYSRRARLRGALEAEPRAE